MAAGGPGDDGRPEDGSNGIRATFDWSSTDPSQAVVETVAVASDREPKAIEPLYDVVDPDALDSLVGANGTVPSRSGPTVTFGFAGYDVSVRGDGTVIVRPDGTQTGGE
jgi:hypothetical protein